MSVELKKSYSRIINQIKSLGTNRSNIPANIFCNSALIKNSIDSLRKKASMRKANPIFPSKADLSRNDNATERIKETISTMTTQFIRNRPMSQTARNEYYKSKNNSFEGNAKYNIKIKFNQMRHLLNQSSNANVFVNGNNANNNSRRGTTGYNNGNAYLIYKRLSESQSIESYAKELSKGYNEKNKVRKGNKAYPTLIAMGISVNRMRPSNSCSDLGFGTRINLLNC